MLRDIRDFWATTYPQVYGHPYMDLQGGIHAVYPGAANVPGCGSGQTTYEDVKGNAFYCPQGDFFAFDDATLFPQIYAKFGPYTLGMIAAHEWGHAIQARAGVSNQPSIVLEQQADCFAGSWMAHLARNESPYLHPTQSDLQSAFAGMLTFRDPTGTTAAQRQAHGSGFDRVSAFQDGFTNGASKCATYPSNPPTVVELPFSEADLQTRGNEPYAQVLIDVPADLDRYWNQSVTGLGKSYQPLAGQLTPYSSAGPLPNCGGTAVPANTVMFCPADGKIYYDKDFLSGPVYQIGDFAVGLLLANAWSDAVQTQLGVPTSGKDASLQGDCMTGSWAGDIVPKQGSQQKFTLSAGDLDEGLSALLRYGTKAPEQTGTVFERAASLRKGLLQGLPACGLP
jgi:predicted metalloprotease